MAVSADQVVIELTAKTDGFTTPMATASTALTTFASRAEQSATQVETSIERSSGQSGQALLILQAIARRTADQFAAGAPVATILAEHISGIAEAAEFAGGPVNLLGIAISGGLGLAITVVLPLLVSLGGEMLHAAASADEHKKKTEDLGTALQKLAEASNKAIQSTEAATQASYQSARAKEAEAVAVARTTAAKLAEAKADRDATDRSIKEVGGGSAASGGLGLASFVQEYFAGKAEDKNDKALEAALAGMDAIRDNGINARIKDSEARTSDTTAAIRKFNKTKDDLVEQLRTFQISKEQFDKRLDDATRLRDTTTEYKAPKSNRAAESEAYSLAAAQSKLAAATTDVGRAEAELAIVEAKRRDYTPAAYQAALTSARANIEEAKSLEELKKAANELLPILTRANDAGAKGILRDDGFKDAIKDANGERKGSQDAVLGATHDQFEQQKQGVRTLANLYESLFNDGSRNIWQSFTKLGEQAIAKFAAQKTFEFLLSALGGSSSGIGGFLNGLIGGHDTGGSFTVGGLAGIDNNLLSLNGRPVSRVSQGEQVAIIPSAAKLRSSAQSGANAPGGGTTVVQSFTLDARYGITTPELIAHVNDTATQAAMFGAQAGAQGGFHEVMRQAARPSLPRSTG